MAWFERYAVYFKWSKAWSASDLIFLSNSWFETFFCSYDTVRVKSYNLIYNMIKYDTLIHLNDTYLYPEPSLQIIIHLSDTPTFLQCIWLLSSGVSDIRKKTLLSPAGDQRMIQWYRRYNMFSFILLFYKWAMKPMILDI